MGNPKDKVEMRQSLERMGKLKDQLKLNIKGHVTHFRFGRVELSAIAQHLIKNGHYRKRLRSLISKRW